MARSIWFPATVLLIVGLWAYTRFGPRPGEDSTPPMPAWVSDAEEREIFLTPGGAYTAADIAANGSVTASQKYAGFQARHDTNPQPGEIVCPVTRTRADPRCTWVIGGRTYLFCCPPCIGEFLRMAKRNPGEVRLPEEYVQR
jgi:hypothetical protein